MLNATPFQLTETGIPTDASFVLLAGVPIVSLIAGPMYMYDDADTMDKVDRVSSVRSHCSSATWWTPSIRRQAAASDCCHDEAPRRAGGGDGARRRRCWRRRRRNGHRIGGTGGTHPGEQPRCRIDGGRPGVHGALPLDLGRRETGHADGFAPVAEGTGPQGRLAAGRGTT